LFGSTNATNQPQTSLFGKPSTGTSSIFGSMPQQQQQQQQQQPPSLFGSTTQPAQSTGGFGTSSLFGKPATRYVYWSRPMLLQCRLSKQS
jgi:hypothetical protein